MRKTIMEIAISLIAAVLLSPVGALPLRAETFPVSGDENANYCRLERMVDQNRTNLTPHFAIVKTFADPGIGCDVWVPVELLTQMNLPVKLNAARSSLAVRVANPAATLGIPALSALAPGGLDLDFRVRSDDNVLRFNLRGAERIAGLSYVLTDRGTVLVGTPNLLESAPFPRETAFGALKKPFNLVWDHVLGENKDLSLEDALPGLNVLSPTWFALADETGASLNRGSAAYVEAANQKGYRVWALVSNGFNRDRTRKFFADAGAQNLFIARLLAYARIYGFDGINVDFENVDNADAVRLTAFVKKLTAAARTMGLAMSIDVMVPSKWSACYERHALSQVVDYVAVMTYDEHWRTSPKAGSTASLPWVRRGLQNTLAQVPADKLLLGVPFYTREWEESRGAKGKISVKSKTMAMASADERILETGAAKRWLDETGQHYFQYASGDKTLKVWMEDENSIRLRMDLVKKHNLAGAAFWRKGFEKPEIWEEIARATR